MSVKRFAAFRRRRWRGNVPLIGGVLVAVGLVSALAAGITVPSSNVGHITNLPGPPPVTATTTAPETTDSVVDTSVVDTSMVDPSVVDPPLVDPSLVPPDPGSTTATP